MKQLLSLFGLQPAEPKLTSRSVPLEFIVHSEYPDTVLEADKSRFVAIGKKGGESLYSILCLNLTQKDIETMCAIKGKITNYLLSQESICEDIKHIESLCIAELQNCSTSEERGVLSMLLSNDIAGYGPISILMRDPDIEEIEINAPEARIAVYHANHGRCMTNLSFRNEACLRSAINKLISSADKELNSFNPIIDAQLWDGSRIHAQMKPYAMSGMLATIRLQSRKKCDIRKLLENCTVSPQMIAYLWMALETRCNMVISGSPASGKTTMLMALHALIPPYERVVTVEEEVNELTMHRNFTNVVSLQGSSQKRDGADMSEQVKNALRMRPDRLIIGEIRGRESKEAFSGANIGVPFITTMHSSGNGEVLLNRLRAMPMGIEDYNISMLDLSLFMTRLGSGERRVANIIEYKWLSRLETEMPDACGKITEKEILLLAENSTINKESLKKSKVIARWAKANLTSEAKALQEYKYREKYIQKLLDKGNSMETETRRYIEGYYTEK